MRDAAAREARGDALRVEAEVGEREEAAIALAERGPGAAAELGDADVLEVTHDGSGEQSLEVIRLGARIPAARDGLGARVLAAASAALVWQHHAEVLDGLGDPAVRGGREQTRALAARTALEEHEQGQVPADVLGCADRAVEHVDALAGRQSVRGGSLGLGAAPVEWDLHGVVLDVKAGQVVAC